MKLFAVFVGGNHPRANVELHDVRFCVGETLEDTIPQLRAAWWGTPQSLHIDGYAELTHVDRRPIRVVSGPVPAGPRLALWFINVGGYTPELFGEQHHYLFMTGTEKSEVWTRARALSPEWTGRHKDNFTAIDDILEVSTLLPGNLHLDIGEPDPSVPDPRIVSDYTEL
ncbi:MAG TPA: DUF1543 domain-containing protein [Hyphomonas sp.]|nr:DUF1543 domain-containing protein [Hyphomonas sp.]HRJ01795.1 DUF1543 domain-containing protein [Hyphomonas sp.]HRK68495.1 DUF1543 domain-containing protein [Hyphomonas sp.]